MSFVNSKSLLQPCSKSEYLAQYLKEYETTLQAIIKIEENGIEQYIMRFQQCFIVLYPVNGGVGEQLSFISTDLNLKLSRIYIQASSIAIRNAAYPIGFKLQNQQGKTISFYFKTANQVYSWIKELSIHVTQSGFQKLYKPIRRLGKGGSASVYQVLRLQDGKKLAAKVFSKSVLQKSLSKKGIFKKQLNTLKDLSFENILRFQGVFQNHDAFYLLMQLAKGVNIYEFLLNKKDKLQSEQISKIMRNILNNLKSLQELNIIHRDIKLQNIIINPLSLKTNIIDYGLAVYADDEDYIYYHCGTPGFISPETIRNQKKQQISTKSDIFSAAVIFHVLLTGKYLFDGKDEKQLYLKNASMQFELACLKQKEVDKSAVDLLQKMLALQPEDRYSASQCLQHAFLKDQSADQDQDKLPTTPSTIRDRQHYQF